MISFNESSGLVSITIESDLDNVWTLHNAALTSFSHKMHKNLLKAMFGGQKLLLIILALELRGTPAHCMP